VADRVDVVEKSVKLYRWFAEVFMPVTRKIGYRCTCQALVPLEDIKSEAEFEKRQRELRQSGRTMMVTHAKAIGGCGETKRLRADDLVLIEHEARA